MKNTHDGDKEKTSVLSLVRALTEGGFHRMLLPFRVTLVDRLADPACVETTVSRFQLSMRRHGNGN